MKHIKLFEEFINETNVFEASIHFNPKKAEPLFKKLGLDVPEYPKTGKVFYKGKEVGHVNNFQGLVIRTKEVMDLLTPYAKQYDLGIWNPDDVDESNVYESSDEPKFAAGDKVLVTNKKDKWYNTERTILKVDIKKAGLKQHSYLIGTDNDARAFGESDLTFA